MYKAREMVIFTSGFLKVVLSRRFHFPANAKLGLIEVQLLPCVYIYIYMFYAYACTLRVEMREREKKEKEKKEKKKEERKRRKRGDGHA